jgi:hypothetical protein
MVLSHVRNAPNPATRQSSPLLWPASLPRITRPPGGLPERMPSPRFEDNLKRKLEQIDRYRELSTPLAHN